MWAKNIPVLAGSWQCYIMIRLLSFTLSGTWLSPTVRGIRPPPGNKFSFTKTDDHHAVLFGGWDQKRRRSTNDAYILDLTTMVSFAKISAYSHSHFDFSIQYSTPVNFRCWHACCAATSLHAWPGFHVRLGGGRGADICSGVGTKNGLGGQEFVLL